MFFFFLWNSCPFLFGSALMWHRKRALGPAAPETSYGRWSGGWLGMERRDSPALSIHSTRRGKGLNIHQKLRQIFSLKLREKGIVEGELLQHLTGCLRAADNHLCGRTTAWEKGEAEIEEGWIEMWVQLEEHLGRCQRGVWRWWAWFCSLQMES